MSCNVSCKHGNVNVGTEIAMARGVTRRSRGTGSAETGGVWSPFICIRYLLRGKALPLLINNCVTGVLGLGRRHEMPGIADA